MSGVAVGVAAALVAFAASPVAGAAGEVAGAAPAAPFVAALVAGAGFAGGCAGFAAAGGCESGVIDGDDGAVEVLSPEAESAAAVGFFGGFNHANP